MKDMLRPRDGKIATGNSDRNMSEREKFGAGSICKQHVSMKARARKGSFYLRAWQPCNERAVMNEGLQLNH
jgi:hypothetical protein